MTWASSGGGKEKKGKEEVGFGGGVAASAIGENRGHHMHRLHVAA